MIYDIQKASMWKRISALLFDIIMLGIVAVGVAFLLSVILKLDAHSEELMRLYNHCEETYGFSLSITPDQYNSLTEAGRADINALHRAANLVVYIYLCLISFGALATYLVSELLVPILLGNGQTLGKKIFGIGLMRVDGVRITTFQLCVRTILGKYTMETMVPIFLVLIFFFRPEFSLVSLVGLALLTITQFIMLVTNRYRTPIHDMIAATVTVDLASQLIFDTPEDLMEYKKKLHAEAAEKAEYR